MDDDYMIMLCYVLTCLQYLGTLDQDLILYLNDDGGSWKLCTKGMRMTDGINQGNIIQKYN